MCGVAENMCMCVLNRTVYVCVNLLACVCGVWKKKSWTGRNLKMY